MAFRGLGKIKPELMRACGSNLEWVQQESCFVYWMVSVAKDTQVGRDKHKDLERAKHVDASRKVTNT